MYIRLTSEEAKERSYMNAVQTIARPRAHAQTETCMKSLPHTASAICGKSDNRQPCISCYMWKRTA